jgi:hypothetical protein
VSAATRMILLLLPLIVSGCGSSDAEIANGDDPLRALTVNHPLDRYSSSYWTRTMGEDAELWAKAVAYCEEHNDAEHPNCGAVRSARMMERMSRPPEDRPNDFRLTVPQAAEPNDAPRRP